MENLTKCPCKSKTVIGCIGLAAYGVWLTAHGNSETGLAIIGTAITTIFARTSTKKLTFKK